jgi:tetratricopeptide (TPR) repeat protein
MVEGVRENPDDTEQVLVFLDVLIFARQWRQQDRDLSWISAAIKPNVATQAQNIASRLKTLEQWDVASAFFRRAIATPLTHEEVRDYGNQFQLVMSPEMLRALFAVTAREGLAQCLIKMQKNDEAQNLMVEAADIRKEHKLPMNAFLAGEVQAASGARVIEGRIKKQEKLSEDDPQYWRKRAEYYRGRREPENEEQALLKALSLTTPQPMPEQRSKGYTDLRSWVLSDYAHFLERMKRVPEAVTLLRKELAEAPAASESSKRAARLLAFDFVKHITVDDDLLWKWLSERTKWEHTEQRVLWRMLEKADRNRVAGYFSRAEMLTEDKDPSRAYALGWIMNRMEHPKRSIPLLEYAVEAAAEDDLKEQAAMALFESYLDVRDWSRAERIFPDARKRLSVPEETDWYTRIAVAAAASGERAEAMRIWLVAANANPARPLWLRQLAKHGLKDKLNAFYQNLAKQLPESNAPAKALKILEEVK